MNAALLLLADSRLPAGGHAHSGGAEEAIRAGAVRDLASLAAFLRGRLATAGAVAAGLAAAACDLAASREAGTAAAATAGATTIGTGNGAGNDHAGEDPRGRSADGLPARSRPDGRPSPDAAWERLDAEADARTSSPAQREASRTQGRLLLRSARRIWPSPILDDLARAAPAGAHHAVALGAVAAAAGCSPAEAALAAAYTAVTGPATAAVRLLGLDPVPVHRLLAALAPDLERIATGSAAHLAGPPDPGSGEEAGVPGSGPDGRIGAPAPGPDGRPGTPGSGSAGEAGAPDPWERLPAPTAPALDLLAERHVRAEPRMFVS
ncbi:urease accessory protein UreF [Streptosporangium sp. NPDC004379]|uniref:urease accessory protein UreF n=1 Tax=Streptosporangium sp. NPDC004379 TaxID=3366189 RepID=UPI0036CF1E1C